MRDSRLLEPANDYEAWLRDFDLRDIDAANERSMWVLRYRSRLRRALSALRGLPEGATILEVGASQANPSLLAAEQGLRAVALDREPRALAYARRKHERGVFAVVCGLAEALPIAGEACAAVLALEILEHVPDPPAVLREMRRVLQPGGRLVVTTPNAEYVRERLPSYGRRGRVTASPRADAEGHLFAFALRELRELAEDAGFTVREAGYEGSLAMSERVGPARLLPAATTLRLSRALNRLPGARHWSLACFLVGERPPAPP